MALRKPSRDQLRYLELASAAKDASEAGRYLYMGAGEPGRQGEEISPKWLDLWMLWSEDIARTMPASVFEELATRMEGLSPVDEDIHRIRLRDEDKVAILIGAGASYPPPSGIPTVAGLLPELLGRAKKLGRDEIDKLVQWCDDNNVTNIEDLLTAAYVADFAAKRPSVTGLLNYFLSPRRESDPGGNALRADRVPRRTGREIAAGVSHLQDTLQTLFGLLTSRMLPAKPNAAHDAIVELVRKHPRTSVITTNYDGCIDEALLTAEVPFATLLESPELPEGSVPLIKMHGSINWYYCDSCQAVREFDLIDVKRAYESDRLTYAVIGICKVCGGQRRPLLVPPMAFKFIMFPNLIRIWDQGRALIEDADYLIVVGYSFSEADTYISKIISRSLTATTHQRLIVCDTDSSLVPILRERLAARIVDFDPVRVLRAVGSCETILPSLLEGIAARPARTMAVPARKNGEREGADGKMRAGRGSRRG